VFFSEHSVHWETQLNNLLHDVITLTMTTTNQTATFRLFSSRFWTTMARLCGVEGVTAAVA